MADSVRVKSGVDRISALPDELLCRILSFVQTKMAVCTSVLSTRWRCLYTLVSSLDFVMDMDGNAADAADKANRFVNFVERILLLHTRPVERFRLKFHHHIDPLRVDGWIRGLVLRNIQELELCTAHNTKSYLLPLPATLFSCKTLVVLKLSNESSDNQWNALRIPAKALLPNLKVLHIVQAAFAGPRVNSLLSSCPVLDDLVLSKCIIMNINSGYKLNIYNARLKRLSITFLAFPPLDPTQHLTPQIVINCPALMDLILVRFKRCTVALVAPKTLARVVIGSLSQDPPNYANIHAVLMAIKNTHLLQIHDDINIIAGLYNQNLPLPSFERLAYLKIRNCGCLFDTHCLKYLLGRCVVLETLVFECTKKHSTTQSTRIHPLLPQSPLTDLLSHVKTIEVQLFQIEDAEVEALVKTIQFFLINATVLENLSVRICHFPDAQQREIMREVIPLPRVSKKCQVFLERLS